MGILERKVFQVEGMVMQRPWGRAEHAWYRNSKETQRMRDREGAGEAGR